jgi:hypothetical protein
VSDVTQDEGRGHPREMSRMQRASGRWRRLLKSTQRQQMEVLRVALVALVVGDVATTATATVARG